MHDLAVAGTAGSQVLALASPHAPQPAD